MWIESSWHAVAAFGVGALVSHLLTRRQCRRRATIEIERHVRARTEADSRAQQVQHDLAMARLREEALRRRGPASQQPLPAPGAPLPPPPRPAFAKDPVPVAEPSLAFADTQPSDWS